MVPDDELPDGHASAQASPYYLFVLMVSTGQRKNRSAQTQVLASQIDARTLQRVWAYGALG